MRNLIIAIMLMVASMNFAVAQTQAEVMKLVKETKVLIEQDAEKAFKSINEDGAIKPYLFVYDEDYVVFAHGYKPELVGTVRQGLTPYLISMVDKILKQGSGWFTYRYENPLTGKEENKIAYQEVVIGSDGKKYIVGSGIYADALIKKALNVAPDSNVLAVNCQYIRGDCTDVTLKYKDGEFIAGLDNGNMFVPIKKDGTVDGFNWGIFSNKKIGSFDITKEKLISCKLWVKIRGFMVFSIVDRFDLACPDDKVSK